MRFSGNKYRRQCLYLSLFVIFGSKSRRWDDCNCILHIYSSITFKIQYDVVTGSQTIQVGVPCGSIIFFGRGQADNANAIYMIDGFDYVVKITESSEFVTLSYSGGTLTIKNNASVAINYTIIRPN